MKLFILVIIICLSAQVAFSFPQYTLLSGNRCINCHFNVQGGALRNDLGWYSASDESLIKPEWIGLDSVFGAFKGNTLFNKKVFLGFDTRFIYNNNAYLVKYMGDQVKMFPMELTLYGGIKATDWLSANFGFNSSYFLQGSMYSLNLKQSWSASVEMQPDKEYPQLRMGYFQPSTGIRYEDHTNLVRQFIIPSKGMINRRPMVPIDYADWGAEINYYSEKWLQLTAGVHRSNNFAFQNGSIRFKQGSSFKYLDIIDSSKMAFLVKGVINEKLPDYKLNGMIGASLFSISDFWMANSFYGIGYGGIVSLLTEVCTSYKKDVQKTTNYALDLNIEASEGLVGIIGYQKGNTQIFGNAPLTADYAQWIFGVKAYLLPYIEFRPEYRLIKPGDMDSFSHYVLQFHIFY
ncbi:MAG: hypothetical protein NT007_12855 [Candidatus Kapabacteria bacterium]|nr:hypothetical protein [Candidatus Kapabacteria bacterium]